MTNYAGISVQSAIRESFGVGDLLPEEIVTDQAFSSDNYELHASVNCI
jgi:hypothetical protein